MPTFTYKARSADGQAISGRMDMAGERGVLRALEEQGVYPVEIKPVGEKRGFLARAGGGRVKISSDDRILFTRQLESMLQAGISLTGSLRALGDQSANENMSRIVNDVRKSIEQGATLAIALEKHPQLYSPTYSNMIRAGEESGLMSEMIGRIGELLEYEVETRSRVKSAVFYPAIVISELVLAIGIVVRFVFPRFKALFASQDASLPVPTKIMIVLSDAAEKYSVPFLIGVVVAGFAIRWWVKRPSGRRLVDTIALKMPIMGEIMLKIMMSRFSKILSSLLQAGLPLLRSLQIVERTIPNTVIKAEILAMEDGVRRGRSVAESVQADGVFPEAVRKMLEVGEQSGRIGEMLERVAGFYDRDVDYRIKNLTTVIEPIMLIVLGASVLFVALAVFLPMWDLMGALSGG